MKNQTLTAQKYSDLRDAFDKMLKCSSNKMYVPRSFYIGQLMEMTAPRFYIAPRQAEVIVSAYYRGGRQRKKCMGSVRSQQMAEDLAENYERLRKLHPYEPQWSIWERVVLCPAKSFYMSAYCINGVVYNNKRYQHGRA